MLGSPAQKHIKSKNRVRDQGEVFTAEREVNAMLDLVKNETEKIDSKFLEPACGDGNFLAPILTRKIGLVERRYKKSQLEYERNAITAVGSIYGVELMQDNVDECRERLYKIFENYYMSQYKKRARVSICLSVKKILEHNIRQGNALTLKDETGDPIIFSEWSRPFNDSRVKRHDWSFEEMIDRDEPSIFKKGYVSDLDKIEFIPRSIKEYPIIQMTRIGDLIT